MKTITKKDRFPVVTETFRDVSGYWLDNLTRTEPSCFNGIVDVVKYRITVEKIVEDTSIYQERLQKLWEECDNYHHWEPLQNKAKELGVILTGERGCKRKPR